MRTILTALAAMAASILIVLPACAETLYLRGKVTLEGGAPPGKLVSVEQVCTGADTKIVATAAKSGDYIWRADAGFLGLDVFGGTGTGGASITGRGRSGAATVTSGLGVGECVLRASLQGYRSTTIDIMDKSLFQSPGLPVLVLMPKRPGEDVAIDRSLAIPGSVRRNWVLAEKAMGKQNWPEAERLLRAATATDPKFTLGWMALGLAYHNERMAPESRDAYRRAVALNPKHLQTQLMLVQANLECQDWAEASRGAAALIAADARHRHLDAYLDDAIALYHLREMERAEARVKELLQLDKAHSYPRAEYLLGLILEGRQELASAREHMVKYLELQPRATDAPAVRTRIDNLGKPGAAAVDDEINAPNMTAAAPGEATVPGGLKAFAAIARLENQPTYDSFFLDYCRRLLHETSPYTGDHIPAYTGQLQAYMAAVDEFTAAGQKRADNSAIVTLSLKNADERKKTARLLRQLGWMLNETGQYPKVELGDQPADGLRHGIPTALGINEIAMRNALEAGRDFEFEIRSESARLIGGIRWAAVLKDLPPFPGGMAEVFSRDVQFAKAYAGLGAMGVDSALGLISAVGVRDLVTRHAGVLELCSGALTESSERVSTPGGKEALQVWTELAGADPTQPVEFFRALLAKDGGRLAVFYSALSQVDESRQRYFTGDAARALRYYEWYRDSPDLRTIESGRMPNRWRGDLFGKLPLDDGGRVRFPGGRTAWSNSTGPDEEALLRSEWLEAFIPVASLEEKRGSPLDAAAVTLLARHYAEWRSLFPYFEKLPGLGSAEFQGLAAFASAAIDQASAARNTLVGEWHSLVKLIVLGAQAGSLDQAAAAGAFARVCGVFAGPDPSPKALAALREIAGGQGSLDEAVAIRLLRLDGPRRASFDRVRQLQSAPTLDAALSAPTPAVTLAALSGAVYAAVLDPDCLLISEDPQVLSRHRFVLSIDPKVRSGFFPTELVRTTKDSASYMTGGFMSFEETARSLARYKRPLESDAAPVAATPGSGRSAPAPGAAVQPVETVFRVSGRLVEVHATVTDGRGRYSDDVLRTEFALLDDGKPVAVASFENQSSAISVALLFDATGSMQNALPPLKSAALKLIGEMRPMDAVAVYSFNVGVTELQPFTTDKAAAERAILGAHAEGATALYDALVRVNHDLAGRTGKKAIVVFTDGADNQSVLTAAIAIARARTAAAPIYTIAQGSALRDSLLLEQLAGISKSTGGLPFAIREPAEILKVFESVSNDLTHGYLLTFQPPPDESAGWHNIKVTLPAPKGRTVRAREGYQME
jgi:Ca-activated chloride channel homolog